MLARSGACDDCSRTGIVSSSGFQREMITPSEMLNRIPLPERGAGHLRLGYIAAKPRAFLCSGYAKIYFPFSKNSHLNCTNTQLCIPMFYDSMKHFAGSMHDYTRFFTQFQIFYSPRHYLTKISSFFCYNLSCKEKLTKQSI